MGRANELIIRRTRGVLEVRSFDITRPDFIGKDVDALIERLGAELGLSFVLADIGRGSRSRVEERQA